MKVSVINKSNNPLPNYAKPGDAGMDLRADFSRGVSEEYMWGTVYDEQRGVVIIFPGGRYLVPTGLFTAFPVGYEFQVRPRSGLALKHGITVLNTPGTIDCGYRNEWGVILMNLGDEPFEISHGDRIAQGVLTKVTLCEWNEIDTLDNNDRKGGFGSSGIK